MKQAIGGGLAVVCVAWLLYVFTTPEPCERVSRGASPVRVTADIARWGAKNWLSQEGRLDMIRWSIQADQAVQSFLTHQFYGEGAQCVVPRPRPRPTSETAPASATSASAASEPAGGAQ